MFKKLNNRQADSAPSGPKTTRITWGVSLVALGVIAFIFLTYELVERLWLTEVDMDVLHFLHILRGVGTSVIIGFLVGWYILRKGVSIFPLVQVELQKEEPTSC